MANPQIGDAFRINNPNYPTKHLYVVVCVSAGREIAVAFNFSTYDTQNPLFDSACIVKPEEYPSGLREKSFVVYSEGLCIDFSKWDKFISLCGGLTTSAPVTLSNKMRAGAIDSRRTAGKIKEICKASPAKPPL